MLGRAVERFVRTVTEAPVVWTLVTLAIMAGSAYSASHITLQDDARTMLAGADPEIGGLLQALSDFTAMDQLLLHIDGSAAGGDDSRPIGKRLVAAATEVTDHLLDSGQFEAAYFEVSPTAQLHLADTLMPRRFILDRRDPEVIFAPEALATALRRTRADLIAPHGIVQKSMLLRDPVASLRTALAPMSATPGLSKLDPSSGRLFSRDGRSLLIVATPKGNPFGRQAATATMRVVAQAQKHLAQAEPQMALRAIGSHRFTADAQSMVMGDVHRSAALTLLIIIVIFVAFFRSLRLVLVALPPLAFGACVAGGIAGLLGEPVHGIVLAFAAACLGLSIDYTIHLLAALPSHAGEDRRAALCTSARRIGGSLAVAAASTAAGLFALGLSSVSALQQMALLATGAVLGSFVGNLLWVPILLPRLGGPLQKPEVLAGPWHATASLAQRRPRPVVLGTIVVALLLGLGTFGVSLDGNLQNLDSRTPSGLADEQAFTAAFGDPNTAALVLSQGASLDAALEAAHRGSEVLRDAGVNKVITPTLVAPPQSVVQRRRQAWCSATPSYAQRLDDAATQLGFKAGSFGDFTADLDRLCAASWRLHFAPDAALAALGDLLGRPIVRAGADGVRLAVAFEAEPNQLEVVRQRLAEARLTMAHRTSLNARVVGIISDELPRLGGVAIALVALLVTVVSGSLLHTLTALLPCLLGILATLGIFGAMGVPINLMNLCVFPLLAGLGIDYGILMADARTDPSKHAVFERAFSIVVAAATTLAGFGTLAIARYYAIATIGRSVLLAVSACAIFSLLVPVAMHNFKNKR